MNPFTSCRLNCKNEFLAFFSFRFCGFRWIPSPPTWSRRRTPTDGFPPPVAGCSMHGTGCAPHQAHGVPHSRRTTPTTAASPPLHAGPPLGRAIHGRKKGKRKKKRRKKQEKKTMTVGAQQPRRCTPCRRSGFIPRRASSPAPARSRTLPSAPRRPPHGRDSLPLDLAVPSSGRATVARLRRHRRRSGQPPHAQAGPAPVSRKCRLKERRK